MAFGISFGSKTQKVDQTKTGATTEIGTQSGLSTQNQTTNQSSNSATSGLTKSANREDQYGASTSDQTSRNRQVQDTTTQNFSDRTLGSLEGVVNRLMGSDGLGEINNTSNFNLQDFIDNGMRAAGARAQTDVDAALGGIFDSLGGRNNSAAALLTQRVNNDSNAALAGTRAQLTSEGEKIARDNLLAGNTVTATKNDLLTNLLSGLRGGVTRTTGDVVETGEQSQANQNIGTNVGSGSQSSQQNTQTNATENLINVLSQLLNTRTDGTTTENLKGTTKSSGGGLSLSI